MQTFRQRADQLTEIVKQMEKQAEESQLFALGYIIPQLTLVAEYVEPEGDFDTCFTRWLHQVFADDGINDTDQQEIFQLWQRALKQADL